MTTLTVKADVEAVVHEDVEHVVTAKKRVIAVGLDVVLTNSPLIKGARGILLRFLNTRPPSSRENPCEE